MKKYILLVFSCIVFTHAFAESWSAEQLANANTASAINYLTQAEKDAIMYINLARLFPKEFVKFELINYAAPIKFGDYLKNSSYKKSLQNELNKMKPIRAMVFDSVQYADAKCFAKDMGDRGIIGHQRKTCKASNYAECCSYGMETGKDIAMQWLIDHDVPGVGHRKNCLEKDYTKIAVCTHAHKKWQICAVAEMNF
jgi:uncharacterized protein YkwD